MTKSWSSFAKDKLIMEAWRNHINEEPQQVDELFGQSRKDKWEKIATGETGGGGQDEYPATEVTTLLQTLRQINQRLGGNKEDEAKIQDELQKLIISQEFIIKEQGGPLVLGRPLQLDLTNFPTLTTLWQTAQQQPQIFKVLQDAFTRAGFTGEPAAATPGTGAHVPPPAAPTAPPPPAAPTAQPQPGETTPQPGETEGPPGTEEPATPPPPVGAGGPSAEPGPDHWTRQLANAANLEEFGAMYERIRQAIGNERLFSWEKIMADLDAGMDASEASNMISSFKVPRDENNATPHQLKFIELAQAYKGAGEVPAAAEEEAAPGEPEEEAAASDDEAEEKEKEAKKYGHVLSSMAMRALKKDFSRQYGTFERAYAEKYPNNNFEDDLNEFINILGSIKQFRRVPAPSRPEGVRPRNPVTEARTPDQLVDGGKGLGIDPAAKGKESWVIVRNLLRQAQQAPGPSGKARDNATNRILQVATESVPGPAFFKSIYDSVLELGKEAEPAGTKGRTPAGRLGPEAGLGSGKSKEAFFGPSGVGAGKEGLPGGIDEKQQLQEQMHRWQQLAGIIKG